MDSFLPLTTGHLRHQTRGRFGQGGRWIGEEKTGAEKQISEGQMETNMSRWRWGDRRKASKERKRSSSQFGSCGSFNKLQINMQTSAAPSRLPVWYELGSFFLKTLTVYDIVVYLTFNPCNHQKKTFFYFDSRENNERCEINPSVFVLVFVA